MFTPICLTITFLVLAFWLRKTIKVSLGTIPTTMQRAAITADTAVASGCNSLLIELDESRLEQAKKLGLPEDATNNDIFEKLTGHKLV